LSEFAGDPLADAAACSRNNRDFACQQVPR
jgi:hypothetical protein